MVELRNRLRSSDTPTPVTPSRGCGAGYACDTPVPVDMQPVALESLQDMTNTTWRLLLHATDSGHLTYTLSAHHWSGAARTSSGIELLSTCRPAELHQVLDQVADVVLHAPPLGQDPLF